MFLRDQAVLFFTLGSLRAVLPSEPESFLLQLSSFPNSPSPPFPAPFLFVGVLFCIPHLLALYGYYFFPWPGLPQNIAVCFGSVPQLGDMVFLRCMHHTNSVNLCKNIEVLLISSEVCGKPLCEIGESEDFLFVCL